MSNKGKTGNKFRKVEISQNKIRKERKKEYKKVIILAVFLLAIVIGSSYALLSTVINGDKKVEMVAGTLKIEYTDGKEISLNKAIPMSDNDGMKTESYTFTVNNVGTLDAKYHVSLEEKDDNTLDRSYIKYSIRELNGEWSDPRYLSNNLIITDNKILPSGDSITYELKMWLVEDAPNEVQGKTYASKVTVNAVQTNADLEVMDVPVIVINGHTTVYMKPGDTYTELGVSDIKYKEELDVADVTIRYEYFDGNETVEVDTVDTTKPGVYYVYYEITDSTGKTGTATRVINIKGEQTNHAPTITLIGDEAVVLKRGDRYVEYGATAIDDEDGDISANIQIVGTVNTDEIGTYTIKYVVRDNNGNLSSVTRTVIVQKNSGSENIPVVDIVNGDKTVTVNPGDTYTEIGAEDLQLGNNLEITDVRVRYEYFDGENTKPVDSVDTTKPGVYYVYYEVTDSEGNVGTVTRVVNVQSSTSNNAPTITLIGDESVVLKRGDRYVEYGARANDTEDGDISANIRIVGTVDTDKVGTYTIKYIITDSAGNVSSATRTVVVQTNKDLIDTDFVQDDSDNTKTTIDISEIVSTNGIQIAITQGNQKPANSELKTVEQLKQEGIISEDGKIVITKNGEYTIWYKDANGNVVSQKVSVTTIDETKPTCNFSSLGYVGVGKRKGITLTCTDPADIVEKELTTDMITTSNDSLRITNISTPIRIENGYMYQIDVTGVKGGNSYLVLNEKVISDKINNKNEETQSSGILISGFAVEVTELTLDITNGNESFVTTVGENIGTLTYRSENTNIATVDNTGKITGVAPGVTTIKVTESNANVEQEVTIYVEKTLTATFEKSGVGVESIQTKQNTCKLTYENTETCTLTGPTITTKEGYTPIGWNSYVYAHEGSNELTINKNTTFYSISRKDEVILTANFDANNATLSNNGPITCSLEAVYNDEAQATTCVITVPEITGSENTPVVVGFSEELSHTTSTTLLGSGADLVLDYANNNHKWYAITRSEEKTYTATFEKSGHGVKKVGKGSASCTIPVTYNGTKQDESCNITFTNIVVDDGYTVIGWNQDATSHEGLAVGSDYALKSDETFYTITRKDEVQYRATFHKNGLGVTEIGNTHATCTIAEVFNNEVQDTTCDISLPSIEVEGLWKVLGWSEDNNAHDNYAKIEDGITLTKLETDLYSISKKDQLVLTASYNSNGSNLSTETASVCVLQEVFNNTARPDSCTFDAPIIQRDNFTIIGYDTNKDSHDKNEAYDKDANQITIDSNNNNLVWYAISKRKINVEYDKNGPAEISKESDSCTIWNSAVSCGITTANITRDTFDIVGWNTYKDADETTEGTVLINKDIQLDDHVKYYAITKKDITITFDKNNALGQTNSDGEIVYDNTVNRNCRISNKETECSVKSPSVVAPYNTPVILGYNTEQNGTESTWGVVRSKDVTENATYYAITKKEAVTFTATFIKQGLGVTSIGSDAKSCTIDPTYNGEQQTDHCSISLPSIEVEDGYTELGWSLEADSNSYIHLTDRVDLYKDETYYAISKKDELVLTATFHKNGAVSQTYFYNSVITTTSDEETVKVSCLLDDAYNENEQAKSCEITVPIINPSPFTPDVVGYAEEEDATEKDVSPNTKVVLTKNIDYYAITKKDAVEFTADFDANSSTLSSTQQLKCRIGTVYNGQEQNASCKVDAPTITANTNTPVVLGYNLDRYNKESNPSYDLDTGKLTLNATNTGRVWYAITKKNTVTYHVNYEIGDNVTSISKNNGECVIPETYNGEKQTTICIIREDDTENNPVITPNTGYSPIGWSQLSSSTVGSPAVVLEKDNMTFYAHAAANHYNINYISDDVTIGTMSVTYDKSFKLKTLEELNLKKRGYVFDHWTSAGVNYTDGATISENLSTEQNGSVDFTAVWQDTEKPVCRFVQMGSTTTQNTTTVVMECTDTGSGIAYKQLTPEDFTLTNAYGQIDSVAEPVEITDGYSYELTVRGLYVGSFNILLPANKISDDSGNSNVEIVTPSPIFVNGRVYSINYTKGDNVNAIGSTSASCTTEGSSLTCFVILPSITPATGYSTKGWYNDTEAFYTDVGEAYELNQDTSGVTLIGTSHDITPPSCSIINNPTVWTQSATINISASDDGSGLHNEPYSWSSPTDGYSADSSFIVTANGSYTAFVRDAAGNYSSCSTTVEKIDTTKPSCAFSNISDTSIVAGNTATIDLTCTDSQSLISTDSISLDSSNFSLSDSFAEIVDVSSPSSITNGYKYTITLKGLSFGTFNISLNPDSIWDYALNYNNTATSSNMTAYNLAVPGSCNDLTYNGYEQTLTSDGIGVNYSGRGATSAGDHLVTVVPQSKYKFSDEESSKSISCNIKKKFVRFTADSFSGVYDADPHSALNAQILNPQSPSDLNDGSLVVGHSASFGISGSITNVGSTPNVLNSVSILDSSSNDVTSNYDVSKVNGSLSIDKRDTTCTSDSSSREYNGEALTNSSGSCTNLVVANDLHGAHTSEFTNTGSITNVASVDAPSTTVDNTIDHVTIYQGTSDVTSNYNITLVKGTLTVSKNSTWAPSLSAISGKSYTGSPINANALASNASGGAVTYTYYTDSSCTSLTNNSDHGAASDGAAPIDYRDGGYYVMATVATTPNYVSKTTSCIAHPFSRKSVAVSWGSTTSFTMNCGGQAPTASVSTGVSGETMNVSRTTGTAVGSYTSTASCSSISGGRADCNNYLLTSTSKDFTIDGKTITIYFNANNNTISKTSASCTTTGSNSTCSITSPTITAHTNTPTVVGFSTSNTGTSTSGWNSNTSKTIETGACGGTVTHGSVSTSPWYAQSYAPKVTHTINFAKGSNVSAIGSTSLSCDRAATYNGTAQASTCNITLPSITPNDGFVTRGWYMGNSAPATSVADSNFKAAASTLAINASNSGSDATKKWYAIARYPTASEVSFNNSVTGFNCTNLQCAIDKLSALS